MPIREACRKDVPAMLSIYAYFVRETAVSFEYEPPSPEEFARRLEEHSARYPWLVWEEEGRVLGYAYAGLPFERAAYRWCAEISCYLAQEPAAGAWAESCTRKSRTFFAGRAAARSTPSSPRQTRRLLPFTAPSATASRRNFRKRASKTADGMARSGWKSSFSRLAHRSIFRFHGGN